MDLSRIATGSLDYWQLLTVEFGVGDVAKQLAGFPCFVYGVSVLNTSQANPAEVQFINGSGGSSLIPLDYSLTTGPAGAAVGESIRDLWPLPGWPYDAGVFINVVSGTVRGALAVAIPVAAPEVS